MPRKQRDYKAEYAARKRRATSAGYKSVKEYSKARKTLGTPRNASPVPKRIARTESESLSRSFKRSEAREWSRKHSHRASSRYRESMTDAEVDRYHHTFVEWIEGSRREVGKEKRSRIRQWLVPDWMTDQEWKSTYQPV